MHDAEFELHALVLSTYLAASWQVVLRVKPATGAPVDQPLKLFGSSNVEFDHVSQPKRKVFTFDAVLGPSTTQQQVFEGATSRLDRHVRVWEQSKRPVRFRTDTALLAS